MIQRLMVCVVPFLCLACIWPTYAGASDLTVCKAPVSETAALQEAERLVAELRQELRPVEDRIRNVPILAALESGRFPLAGLSVLIGEEYHIIQSDWSSFARR